MAEHRLFTVTSNHFIIYIDFCAFWHFTCFQTGDLRFEGHERVRYTRDQLLQLREVLDWFFFVIHKLPYVNHICIFFLCYAIELTCKLSSTLGNVYTTRKVKVDAILLVSCVKKLPYQFVGTIGLFCACSILLTYYFNFWIFYWVVSGPDLLILCLHSFSLCPHSPGCWCPWRYPES